MNKENDNLLEVKNLTTWFYTEEGIVKALEKITFNLRCGEILGLVGETGCGKSVTVSSIMGLIPQPPGRIVEGEVIFSGADLLKFSEVKMQKLRGSEMAMIFQDPMSCLNPVLKVGFQVEEALMAHRNMSSESSRERARHLFELVNLPDPDKTMNCYPHQLSGGMKQRVMIAMALACDPKLLIADEPTTALDVSVQAQILCLIKNLQKDLGRSVIIVSHDLGVIASMAHKVAVMYAGSIVEYGRVEEIFNNPTHPYTRGLIGAIPRLDQDQEFLEIIEGALPNLLKLPEGCKFRERCPMAMDICATARPPRVELENGHEVFCYAYC